MRIALALKMPTNESSWFSAPLKNNSCTVAKPVRRATFARLAFENRPFVIIRLIFFALTYTRHQGTYSKNYKII